MDKYTIDRTPRGLVKRALWLCYFLLIFEGALRKWVLPEWSDALLVVRDPIGIWAILYAWYRGLFRPNLYVWAMWLAGAASFAAALLAGHGNITVALFGLRIAVIYFPLVFVAGTLLDRRDALQMGRVTLLLCIPMTLLMASQFFSPQSAWVNRGLAGDVAGAGFDGANGFMRPPGTFSFISGLADFFAVAIAFLWYFWLNAALARKWLLVAATVSVLCALPLSISRTIYYHAAIGTIFALTYCMMRPRTMWRAALAVVVLAVASLALRGVPFFETATGAMEARFETATAHEGSAERAAGNRFFGSFARGLQVAWHGPMWGEGLGLGTNAGSKIISGERTFMVAEEEWSRVVGEQGMPLGLFTLLLRALLAVQICFPAFRAAVGGDALPWMLCSAATVSMLNGQLANPTILGFFALTSGLAICSLPRRGSLMRV